MSNCEELGNIENRMLEMELELDTKIDALLESMGISHVSVIDGDITQKEAVETFFEKPLKADPSKMFYGFEGTPPPEWWKERSKYILTGLVGETLIERIECMDELKKAIKISKQFCSI